MNKRTYTHKGCTIRPTGLKTASMPAWAAVIPGFRGEFGASTLREMREHIDEVLGGAAGPWTHGRA